MLVGIAIAATPAGEAARAADNRPGYRAIWKIIDTKRRNQATAVAVGATRVRTNARVLYEFVRMDSTAPVLIRRCRVRPGHHLPIWRGCAQGPCIRPVLGRPGGRPRARGRCPGARGDGGARRQPSHAFARPLGRARPRITRYHSTQHSSARGATCSQPRHDDTRCVRLRGVARERRHPQSGLVGTHGR